MAVDPAACARWVPEGDKHSGRSAFARDRARVLHSFAFRRLAGKTQVVGPDEGDFPRTRLTHSLECAQVGRELGQALGCDPDVVEAACLAHDIGHPPFGHNGEAALDRIAGGCGGFEGNAQSLRVLTRLEAKVFDGSGPDARSAGLNLTRATLDAATKYPWGREHGEPRAACGPSGGDLRRPYGVYEGDLEVFTWMRSDSPCRRPCFEAQVMDWADDIAYSVHDLEDGVYAGYVNLRSLHQDPDERRAVCLRTAALYTPDAGPDEVAEVFAGLRALPYWPADYTGDHVSLAGLKHLTSALIGRFSRAAERATARRYGTDRPGGCGVELVVPRRQRLECAVLKGIAAHFVVGRDGAADVRAREQEVLEGLGEALWHGAPASLDAALRTPFERAANDADRRRVVVDQLASLTDGSALFWHRRLTSSGVSYPGG